MGETDSIQPAAPPTPPPLSYKSAPVAPRPALPGVNYFRYSPQEAGWTSVASFGTASIWHSARDWLTQHRIVCRMVADPTNTSTEDQRMDLLVMASEAEWARELLRQCIPELAGTALPPGGLPVVETGKPSVPPPLPDRYLRQPGVTAAGGAKTPLAALPVEPLQRAAKPGQSAVFTTVLVLAFLAMGLLIIAMVAVCFIPGF